MHSICIWTSLLQGLLHTRVCKISLDLFAQISVHFSAFILEHVQVCYFCAENLSDSDANAHNVSRSVFRLGNAKHISYRSHPPPRVSLFLSVLCALMCARRSWPADGRAACEHFSGRQWCVCFLSRWPRREHMLLCAHLSLSQRRCVAAPAELCRSKRGFDVVWARLSCYCSYKLLTHTPSKVCLAA